MFLIPRENERNLRDVPQKIRNSLTIDLVDDVDEVLQRALMVKEGEELFKDVSLDSFSAISRCLRTTRRRSKRVSFRFPSGERFEEIGNSLLRLCFLLDGRGLT
jgi:hypothetical protein